jgi:hypothetical protein
MTPNTMSGVAVPKRRKPISTAPIPTPVKRAIAICILWMRWIGHHSGFMPFTCP